MAQIEPMDIDSIGSDFDNKENSLHISNVLPRTPCTEKGYEELDVSELNMKLRYSITPASSPMSRSFTANCKDNKSIDESLNSTIVNENSLTQSLNSTLRCEKPKLPLQALPTDQFADNTMSLQRSLDNDSNITFTVNGTYNVDENLSIPSTSSSAVQTPEATTPTKDIPRDGGSPIMRGLKSVLNMFRTSQSPIPPEETKAFQSEEQKSHSVLVSTPKAKDKTIDTSSSKRTSPLKDSVVFNEDLERELQWKDDSTIIFKQEKFPKHKLYLNQSTSLALEKKIQSGQENLNLTVEYMDVSYNDSIVADKTMTDIENKVIENIDSASGVDSEGEFLDCETTDTKQETIDINQTKVIENSEEIITLNKTHVNENLHVKEEKAFNVTMPLNIVTDQSENKDANNVDSNEKDNSQGSNAGILQICMSESENYTDSLNNNGHEHMSNTTQTIDVDVKSNTEILEESNDAMLIMEEVEKVTENVLQQGLKVEQSFSEKVDNLTTTIIADEATSIANHEATTSIVTDDLKADILVGIVKNESFNESMKQDFENFDNLFHTRKIDLNLTKEIIHNIEVNNIYVENCENNEMENNTVGNLEDVKEANYFVISELPSDIPLPSDDDIEKDSLTDLPICDLQEKRADDLGSVAGNKTVDLINAMDVLCEEPVNIKTEMTTDATEVSSYDATKLSENIVNSTIAVENVSKDENITSSESILNNDNEPEMNNESVKLQSTITFENDLTLPEAGVEIKYDKHDVCIDQPPQTLNTIFEMESDTHNVTKEQDRTMTCLNQNNVDSLNSVEAVINTGAEIKQDFEYVVETQHDVSNHDVEIKTDTQNVTKEDDTACLNEYKTNVTEMTNIGEEIKQDLQITIEPGQVESNTVLEVEAAMPNEQTFTCLNEKKIDFSNSAMNIIADKATEDEIVISTNSSPFVSVNDLNLPLNRIELDQIESPFETKCKMASSPPISPKLSRKGYNINFDEIDDPFATKTKIRMSPTPETSPKSTNEAANVTHKKMDVQKKIQQNRRKSQPVRQKKDVTKTRFNSSYSYETKSDSKEPVIIPFDNKIKEENKTDDEHNKLLNEPISDLKNDSVCPIPTPVLEPDSLDPVAINKCESENIIATNNIAADFQESVSGSLTEDKESDVTIKANDTYDKQDVSMQSPNKPLPSKNVFNLPEIDDMNFNPFITKSKMRNSPSPTFGKEIKDKFDVTSTMTCETDFAPQTTNTTINIQIQDNTETFNTSSETCSSRTTEKEFTVQEVNTEDEDTAEGPFLEADDFVDVVKITDFGTESDMMQFEDMSAGIENGNKEDGELFIDAEAFEFLLNQNKSNVVADSGKESLFLKFDPLFAKRVSSDGVLAALNRIQKRQNTPKKPPVPVPRTVVEEEKPTTSSSNIGPALGDCQDEVSATLTKPMMVVNPAINSIVSPRKSTTPPRINRRSLTFTSPAMAVIDRLLSLSGNSSTLEPEPTVSRQREYNETDIALTQLRELLAEKEINVHNLRIESKELKERLATMESQVNSLQKESEERLTKINELNERLAEKSKINKSMAVVVEEYERTIASLIAEMEQEKRKNAEERSKLISERDEQTAHLASMEVSFSDLHSKYEKSKQMILSMKANEDTYKKAIKEFEDNLLKMQNNYELLKQHATSKLNHANQELEKFNRAHESEVLKLNAMIKRKELHITSLEESLAQKTKANDELTSICDELINKVG